MSLRRPKGVVLRLGSAFQSLQVFQGHDPSPSQGGRVRPGCGEQDGTLLPLGPLQGSKSGPFPSLRVAT